MPFIKTQSFQDYFVGKFSNYSKIKELIIFGLVLILVLTKTDFTIKK